MRKHQSASKKLSTQFENAKRELLQIETEIRQVSRTIDRKKMLPYRLSNAQYFVHDLHFVFGFEPKEIAKQTDIDILRITHLLTESIHTVGEGELYRLLQLHCAALYSLVFSKSTLVARRRSNLKIV